jgi:hypothetical protein
VKRDPPEMWDLQTTQFRLLEKQRFFSFAIKFTEATRGDRRNLRTFDDEICAILSLPTSRWPENILQSLQPLQLIKFLNFREDLQSTMKLT